MKIGWAFLVLFVLSSHGLAQVNAPDDAYTPRYYRYNALKLFQAKTNNGWQEPTVPAVRIQIFPNNDPMGATLNQSLALLAQNLGIPATADITSPNGQQVPLSEAFERLCFVYGKTPLGRYMCPINQIYKETVDLIRTSEGRVAGIGNTLYQDFLTRLTTAAVAMIGSSVGQDDQWQNWLASTALWLEETPKRLEDIALNRGKSFNYDLISRMLRKPLPATYEIPTAYPTTVADYTAIDHARQQLKDNFLATTAPSIERVRAAQIDTHNNEKRSRVEELVERARARSLPQLQSVQQNEKARKVVKDGSDQLDLAVSTRAAIQTAGKSLLQGQAIQNETAGLMLEALRIQAENSSNTVEMLGILASNTLSEFNSAMNQVEADQQDKADRLIKETANASGIMASTVRHIQSPSSDIVLP